MKGEQHITETELENDDVSVGEEINETMTMLMPWAVSFLFHCGLILIAIFVVWSSAALDKEETVIPVTVMTKRIKPIIEPLKKPDLPVIESVIKRIKTPMNPKGDPLNDPSEATPTDIAAIGVAGNPGAFGSPTGTTGDPGGMFYGGKFESVVYVVDASGSMIESLPFVKQHLKNSIRDLSSRGNQYTVIFYQNGQAIENVGKGNKRGLRPATASNKKHSFNWLSTQKASLTPQGSSNPLKAIQLAISYQPDVIFLLSDNITGSGIYSIEADELLKEINQMQERMAKGSKQVKINTIQFIYDDPMGTLEKIASQNNGKYKFIDAAFVGLQ